MSARTTEALMEPEATRWVKVCLDCLSRGVNARCVVVRVECSPASEPCDWCHRLTTGIRLQRTNTTVVYP